MELRKNMIKFFTQFPEVFAVMSEKVDGSMKIVEDEVIGKQNQQNREVFFRKIGIDGESVVIGNLVHGSNTEVVSSSEQKIVPKTDSLVTTEKNIFLAITIADCVPVFFYEKEQGIVALAHAGWRGIAENILENTANKISQLGGNIENLHIALGSGINKCHFEIKDDVLDKFANYKDFILKKDGKIFMNLKGIIKRQLLALGVKEENIENDSVCTYCSENLFSFRRDKPAITEAMVAMIGFHLTT